MAEEKTSFILYADLLHTVKKMPDDKAGVLLKTILEYVNDLNPSVDDLLVDLVFEPIRQQLKRDLKSYEHRKQERSINGRMGNLKKWNLDLYEKVEKGILSLENAEKEASNRKKSHSDEENRIPIGTDKITSGTIANIADNVNGNGNVTVNGNDINKSLMSEIEISDERLGINEKEWFKIAKSFIQVFKDNKKILGDENLKSLNAAKYKPYVDPIRLLMCSDGYKKEDIQIVYKFLKGKESAFWKKNILSTEKLREKFSQLLIEAKNPKQEKISFGMPQPIGVYQEYNNRIDHSTREDD